MNQIGNSFSSIEQVANQYLSQHTDARPAQKGAGVSFQDVLQRQLQPTPGREAFELKFSKHASMRLDDRNIRLSDEQSSRLENGVQRASEKGIRESLVIVDSLAFIVNVPNQTVVTAMDRSESTDNVFTNIDGAVIV